MRNNRHENRETSAVSRRIGDRSGKAICRTPDMNAVEGSDRAVVPMKLPNKEAQLASAEVVEGNSMTILPLVTETTSEVAVRNGVRNPVRNLCENLSARKAEG